MKQRTCSRQSRVEGDLRLEGSTEAVVAGGGTVVPGDRVAAEVEVVLPLPPPLPKSMKISLLPDRSSLLDISGVLGRITRATTRATCSSAVWIRKDRGKEISFLYYFLHIKETKKIALLSILSN